MSQKTLDGFFGLLKDVYDTSTPQRTSNIMAEFTKKSNIFKSRVTPDDVQKREIGQTVLENNVNYVYNKDIVPTIRNSFQKNDNSNQFPYELEIVGGPVTKEDSKSHNNHLNPASFWRLNKKQPTLRELLENSDKIKRKEPPKLDNPLEKKSPQPSPRTTTTDLGRKLNGIAPTGEQNKTPIGITPNSLPNKASNQQQKSEKLDQPKISEIRKPTQEEIQKEISRKAEEVAKENDRKVREFKQRMRESEQLRKTLLESTKGDGAVLPNIEHVNQEIVKERRNINSLINYLISYNYSNPENQSLTEKVPNEFSSYTEYRKIFEPLLLNEFIANLFSCLNEAVKTKISIKAAMKVSSRSTFEEDDDYTYLDLQVRKNDENEGVVCMKGASKGDEMFDLKFSRNFLVVISDSPTLKTSQINQTDLRTGFTFMGYMGNSEKGQSQSENPRCLIGMSYKKLKGLFKKDWIECYVHPVEKITTFIREYTSLKCLVYSDVSQYIFKPKAVSNIVDRDNTESFNEFFKNISPHYNEGQLEAIKDVCLARNGICLLQGPPGTGKTHTLTGIVSGLYHYLKTSQSTHRRHIMICTPSNTAIDEIITRLKQRGLYTVKGEIIKPKIVRVGVLDKNAHELVKQCCLENQADHEFNLARKRTAGKDEALIMNEIKDKLIKLQREIEKLRALPDHDKALLNRLYDQRTQCHGQFSDTKIIKMNDNERYSQIVENILMSADIICCTLASAGSEKLEKFRDFIEAVIVDEASQCTEPSNIIPLQYSPKKLILIGDPKQLPATTFSQDAYKTQFNRSLFERTLENGVEPFFLSEQYRMTPQIRKFPSLHFYNDRLKDAHSVINRKFPSYLTSFETKNILFLDTKFSMESQHEHSFYNKTEINVCLEFLKSLLQRLKTSTNSKNVIGCISPYQKQVQMINNKLREVFSNEYRDYIAVNTVDAFQGQEKDIIIFSAVRATPGKEKAIGFLSDVRRLNVAITRPKFVLIVLGNSETLASHHTWRSYIEFMAKNNAYINIPNVNASFILILKQNEVDRTIQMVLSREFIPSHMSTLTLSSKQPQKYDHLKHQRGPVRDSLGEGEIKSSIAKSLATASTEPSEKEVILKKKSSREEKKKKLRKNDSTENAILQYDDDYIGNDTINIKRKPAKEESHKFSDDSNNFEQIEKKFKTDGGAALKLVKPDTQSAKKINQQFAAIDKILDPNYSANKQPGKSVSKAELRRSDSKSTPTGLFSKSFLEQREKNKEDEDDPSVITKLFGAYF